MLIFIIVLATGYFEIMKQLWWCPKPRYEQGTGMAYEEPPVRPESPTSDAKSWEDIGVEFRLMTYDIIHRFREEITKRR